MRIVSRLSAKAAGFTQRVHTLDRMSLIRWCRKRGSSPLAPRGSAWRRVPGRRGRHRTARREGWCRKRGSSPLTPRVGAWRRVPGRRGRHRTARSEGWCRKRGSNPHSPCGEPDFESGASASSAIPARKDLFSIASGRRGAGCGTACQVRSACRGQGMRRGQGPREPRPFTAAAVSLTAAPGPWTLDPAPRPLHPVPLHPGTLHMPCTRHPAPGTCACHGVTSFSPTIPDTISPTHTRRIAVAGSLNNTTPSAAVPTVPMPVQIA